MLNSVVAKNQSQNIPLIVWSSQGAKLNICLNSEQAYSTMDHIASSCDWSIKCYFCKRKRE